MSTRIPAEVVEAMRELIAPLDTPERRERYLAGDFPRAQHVNDLSRRYRWDLFWHSSSNSIVFNLDPAVKDTHIDTALRAIVSPLQPEEAS